MQPERSVTDPNSTNEYQRAMRVFEQKTSQDRHDRIRVANSSELSNTTPISFIEHLQHKIAELETSLAQEKARTTPAPCSSKIEGQRFAKEAFNEDISLQDGVNFVTFHFKNGCQRCREQSYKDWKKFREVNHTTSHCHRQDPREI